MKFKPGDKVKVIKPETRFSPEGCTFVSTMYSYIGRTITIAERLEKRYPTDDIIVASGTHYKVRECSYTWWENWLEPIYEDLFTDKDFEL